MTKACTASETGSMAEAEEGSRGTDSDAPAQAPGRVWYCDGVEHRAGRGKRRRREGTKARLTDEEKT